MESWRTLEQSCRSCQRCALADGRRNVVFGAGDLAARVLFVGEGPGAEEDLQGKPFVGRSGRLLDDMLELIGLDRNTSVYITNIVKCRPPNNRDPLHTEQDACIGYLEQQIALLKPQVIVCLGRVAATRLIDEHFKLTEQHGQWFQRNGADITALYHPSALLRDPGKRPETFVDLKGLAAKLAACPMHI